MLIHDVILGVYSNYKVLIDESQSLIYIKGMIKKLKASKALAENLKILREFKDMSLEDLAAKIGVSKQTLWSIETEKSWVGTKTLELLAKYFKVEETDLFEPNKYQIETKLLKK